MVATLLAGVEDQVVDNDVASSKPVVKVDGGTRHVEKDVVLERCLRRLCLKPCRRLLLKEADLADQIVCNLGVLRLVACPAVPAIRITPPSNCVLADESEFVFVDGRVPVVSSEEHSVAIKASVLALCQHNPFAPRNLNGRGPVKRLSRPRELHMSALECMTKLYICIDVCTYTC